MNVSLLNPFDHNLPSTISSTLESGALVARFDTTGRFIAAGLREGTALLWDLGTREIVRHFEGHVKAITSLSWSRNSRFLLTAGRDWNAIIWDLSCMTDPPQRYATIRFDSPLVSASFHPKNSNIILVILSTGEAYIIDQRKGTDERVQLHDATVPVQDGRTPKSKIVVGQFTRSGRQVFIGTSDGFISIFNTRTKEMVARHRIPGSGAIKHIVFDLQDRHFVVNSGDRSLRLFNLSHVTELEPYAEMDPLARMSDPITKVAWNGLTFSANGEFIIGGSGNPAAHELYVWETGIPGEYVKTLDGGKEPLVDVDWHPSMAQICSVSSLGNIFIWAAIPVERWSAFAAGFEEVDENVEYQEREDEFDIEDEEDMARRKMKEEEEDVDVDADDPTYSLRQSVDDEDSRWALRDSEQDSLPWTFHVLIDDDPL